MSKKKSKVAKMEPVDPDRFVSQDKMRDKTENTYEAVMVSAREARRMNLHLKMTGSEIDQSIKVTSEAMKRLLSDEIHFDYHKLPDESK